MLHTECPITYDEFITWLLAQQFDCPIGFKGTFQIKSPIDWAVNELYDLDEFFCGSSYCNFWNGVEKIICPLPKKLCVVNQTLFEELPDSTVITAAVARKILIRSVG